MKLFQKLREFLWGIGFVCRFLELKKISFVFHIWRPGQGGKDE